MIVQVIVSQCFVWCAIFIGRQKLYFYEELGWGVIFTINTIASIILYWTLEIRDGRELLLQLNLLFGAVYLPWQFIHLKALRLNAKHQEINEDYRGIPRSLLIKGLFNSIPMKNRTTNPKAWGGVIGMVWMIAYWFALIPVWIYLIVRIV